MSKLRLDQALTLQKLASTRSQAENVIRLGNVKVNGKVITKPGHFVNESETLTLTSEEKYVSRAGLKLASVAKSLNLNFKSALVLDIGSSTGGFTDYALQHGAKKVIAVDVGTNQLHPSLQGNPKIDLHEKTDIRDFVLQKNAELPTIIVADISFMSLRYILPHVAQNLTSQGTQVAVMVKPQFEAGKDQVNKGVIKNEAVRRKILKDFETWVKQYFVIIDKRDSDVSGAKGNRERFYLLKKSH